MGPGRRKRMSEGKGERKSWSIYTCRMIPGEARMKMRRRMKCKRKERGADVGRDGGYTKSR